MKMVDPVCSMEISEHESNNCMEYEGKHYCFCSEECLEEFRENPALYIEEKTGSEWMV